MYGVLGSEGYSLHQEIVSFDDTHMVDNNLSPEETTQMTCDGMHSIFATKFVEQILSENPSSGSETDKFDNDVIAPAVPIPTASATSDGGGIAEAAAAAAAAKKKDSPTAFAGGGIAATLTTSSTGGRCHALVFACCEADSGRRGGRATHAERQTYGTHRSRRTGEAAGPPGRACTALPRRV